MAYINQVGINQVSGIVKQVLSANSLIIRARLDRESCCPPPEWRCHLTGLRSPDSDWACAAAREYLRRRLVSRDAVLSLDNDEGPGAAAAAGTLYLSDADGCRMSINTELVLAGLALATCHRLAGPEGEARRAKRGVWGGGGGGSGRSPSACFAATPGIGQVLSAVLEEVEDAASWRIQLADWKHSSGLASFRLYGVAAPLPGEPCHEAARFFVEARLLQKRLRLVVCEASFDCGAGGQLRLAGWVPHPSGFISELLVRRGLA
uniref:TNase-like domain-containing protein n=1 Tax=Macrostomum lignano TaxID=282301 RepID=A0A1I8IBR0_9PLAT